MDETQLAFEVNSATYEQNKKIWDEQYKGEFIAIHAGQVVAHDPSEEAVARKLMELQKEKGRFTALVVEVGAPQIYARGPRVNPLLRPDKN